METKAIEVSERAATRVANMSDHVQDMVRHFGADHPLAVSMVESFTRAIGQAFSLLAEGGSLSADGARGLYVVTGYGMHVGVVFFIDHEYRAAMVDETSARMCMGHKRPIIGDAHVCDRADTSDDTFCYARVCMVPGTWSLHS